MKKIISILLITNLLSLSVNAQSSNGFVIKVVDNEMTEKYIQITKNEGSYLFEECFKAHSRCELLSGESNSIIEEDQMDSLATSLSKTSGWQWGGIVLATIATIFVALFVALIMVLGGGEDLDVLDGAEAAEGIWGPATDPLNWPVRTKRKSKLLKLILEKTASVDADGAIVLNVSDVKMDYEGFKERLVESLESRLRKN